MNHPPRLALIFAVVSMASLSACSVSEHAAVIDREVEWVTAMQRKDMDTLEDVMAPDFRLTSSVIPPFALTADNGNPAPGLPGWRWRANLDTMSFGRIELAHVDAVSIADDMIAVNATMTLDEWVIESPEGTGDNSGTYDITDVWVERDGAWRVITRFYRTNPNAPRPRPDFVIDSE